MKHDNKSKKKIYNAIGLMSGTSIDGIDVAMIKSDGQKVIKEKKFNYLPYDQITRDKIKALIDGKVLSLLDIKKIEQAVTKKHTGAVKEFLSKEQLKADDIDIIGFHGHTIIHAPKDKITWQIGNPQMLAQETGINVVADFRTQDLILGGNGAPLVPIYHQALFEKYPVKPLIVLNIGGVSNITYIEDNNENNLVACDVCFGNAPMDDLVRKKIHQNFDQNGELARKGKLNWQLLEALLEEDYFKRPAPKSLDRNHFKSILQKFDEIKLEDSLATLSMIIAQSLADILEYMPKKPMEIIVCGGGRKNQTIMRDIKLATKIKTTNIDELEINGDAIEAEAFAFLAIRNVLKLPISCQKTTGVLSEKHIAQTSKVQRLSSCGGVFYRV